MRATDWGESEIKYLVNNYRKLSSKQLADELQKINTAHIKRSTQAIKAKAKKIGLYKRISWTKEEEEFLFSLIGEYHFDHLVEIYNQWAQKNDSPSRTKAQIQYKTIQRKKSIRLYASSEFLTTRDLSYLLGCNRHTANRLFKAHEKELKVKGKFEKGCQSFVSRRDMKNWLLNHLDIVERYRETVDLVWYSDIIRS